MNYEARHPNQDLPQPTVLIIMPLSRSAIPLGALIEEAFRHSGRPAGCVQVSLPLNTRGESVPIVHCLRHRRNLHTPDQYVGAQQNLNQEYISLTRGVEKTCMWVELQPFGHPGESREAQHHFSAGGYIDERCSAYAKRRNEHLRDHNLAWGVLQKAQA